MPPVGILETPLSLLVAFSGTGCGVLHGSSPRAACSVDIRVSGISASECGAPDGVLESACRTLRTAHEVRRMAKCLQPREGRPPSACPREWVTHPRSAGRLRGPFFRSGRFSAGWGTRHSDSCAAPTTQPIQGVARLFWAEPGEDETSWASGMEHFVALPGPRVTRVLFAGLSGKRMTCVRSRICYPSCLVVCKMPRAAHQAYRLTEGNRHFPGT